MADLPLEIHPEIDRLLKENALLRDALATVLAQLHDLEHLVKPHLLALFQARLGPWELRLLEALCEVARFKRRAELVQAGFNRGQVPDLAAIEERLDSEFLTWKQRLAESAQKIEGAQFRLSHLMEPGDSAELKKLFHSLAKKLHPDVNPELSSEERGLWLQVRSAYEGADLQQLKVLASLIEAGGEGPESVGGWEVLRAENERLKSQLARIYEHVAGLKKQPPFSLQSQWEDEAWVEARRAELEVQTEAARAQAQAHENHLKALLIVYGTGKQSGLN